MRAEESWVKPALRWAGVGMVLAGAAAYVFAMRQRDKRSLRTVDAVDLERYLGTWYEIARLPVSFENGCFATTATYARREDGQIQVVNRCYRAGGAEVVEVEGRARPLDQSNARLKVYFFGPFGGDYWILELGRDYEYALVGSPNRRNLWVLSRRPWLDEETTRGLLERAREQGFDTSQLIFTPQHALS